MSCYSVLPRILQDDSQVDTACVCSAYLYVDPVYVVGAALFHEAFLHGAVARLFLAVASHERKKKNPALSLLGVSLSTGEATRSGFRSTNSGAS